MSLQQIAIYLVCLFAFLFLCRWAYWAGYGRTPRDVCEPVKVLSTGESNPSVTKDRKWGPGSIIPVRRIGEFEYLTASTAHPVTFCTSIIINKREIESSIGGEQ